MKKLRKNQKGFTLVEVIVVLVILAIMAAVLVPSLVSYIDKARENSIVTETRSVVLAVQTLASEKYAKNNDDGNYTVGDDATDEISYDEISVLCEISADDLRSGLGDSVVISNGKIDTLDYVSGNKTCTYPGYVVK